MVGKKPDRGFVKTADLIPGHLYYTGGCWRSVYVYLGRRSDKKFVWYFVGNGESLFHTNVTMLIRNTEVTRSNKKVKPLEEALNDPDAYVNERVKELIQMKFSVDMSYINQQMLDYVY